MDHLEHSPRDRSMTCPACGVRYARGSRFCAHDGHALLPVSPPSMSDSELLARATTVMAPSGQAPAASGPRPPSVSQGSAPARRVTHPLLVDGRYLKLRPLGDGGQGEVWLVQDIHTGRVLALKRFQGSMDIERCRAEVDAAARIEDHSHIVKIHDLHREAEGDGFFMTMEFLDGETLEARLQRPPLMPLGEALDLLIQVARGLAEMHDKGLVHRDVKPANIMLVPDARGTRAKLLDLGIAKSLRPGLKPLTMPGWVVGTLDYAAPEQLRGEPVTPAFDVYALGVVAHELLEGFMPGDTPIAARPLPERLRALIRRMLDVDPSVRPASMHAVARDILAACDASGQLPGLGTRLRLEQSAPGLVLSGPDRAPDRGEIGVSDSDQYRIPRRSLLPRLATMVAMVAAALISLFSPALNFGEERGGDRWATQTPDGGELMVTDLYSVPDVCTPGIRGRQAAC